MLLCQIELGTSIHCLLEQTTKCVHIFLPSHEHKDISRIRVLLLGMNLDHCLNCLLDIIFGWSLEIKKLHGEASPLNVNDRGRKLWLIEKFVV